MPQLNNSAPWEDPMDPDTAEVGQDHDLAPGGGCQTHNSFFSMLEGAAVWEGPCSHSSEGHQAKKNQFLPFLEQVQVCPLLSFPLGSRQPAHLPPRLPQSLYLPGSFSAHLAPRRMSPLTPEQSQSTPRPYKRSGEVLSSRFKWSQPQPFCSEETSRRQALLTGPALEDCLLSSQESAVVHS